MRKLLAVLALLLAGSGVVWADGCPSTVGTTTRYSCTQTVFNDSGSALTSGSVVIWDNDDAEYDRSGYPYVTTATTNGSAHVAGVLVNNSCADQSLCEMVYHGWAFTRIAHSTSAAVEDTTVSTSTVAGEAGDWDGGANECSLGTVLELWNLSTGSLASPAVNNTPMPIWVNISCED